MDRKMINGFRIRQVRELRGLTQNDLAESVGLTQAAIAYIEGGRSQPSEATVNAIALKTGFPPSYFRQETVVNFPLGSLLFRSRTTITSEEKLEAHRYAEVLFEVAEKLASQVNWKSARLPRLMGDPQDAARITRSELGFSPDTPIDNLTQAIEKVGVLVLVIPVQLDGRDAFSGWAGSEEQRPVIVMVNGASGDRYRFSLAHELGHLVLHHTLSPVQLQRGNLRELEQQAHRFASELLMPEMAMRQEITLPVNLSSLAVLKARWKVSMQALARRAMDLSIINERQYRYLFQKLNQTGWRKEEPGNILVEKPRVIRMIAEMLYGVPIHYQKLASNVHLSQQFVKQMFEMHLGKEDILRSNYTNDSQKKSPAQPEAFQHPNHHYS
jgi:Zn-dependent peptidase ImmA (M78 family)/DNA-binding XRE family transcriptional regulator